MFKLFNDIIKGTLKPHLINDDNINKIDELLKVVLVVGENEKGRTLTSTNEWFNLCGEDGRIIIVNLDENNPENHSFKLVLDENLQELINLNIPPPPNDIAEKYLTLIEREAELIKFKINNFIINSSEIKNNEVFALKNIHVLKELAENLRIYSQKLNRKSLNTVTSETCEFVLEPVLQYYIIDLIQTLQKTFAPFTNLKMESEWKLRCTLFGDSFPHIPMFTIFPLLPKTKEYEDFRKEFNSSNKTVLQRNKLNEEGLSIGEFLF